jgi:hypothetical protein
VKVLKLSAQGLPQSWISLEQAVIHYAADEVRWESGGEVAVFHGGHNAHTGQQSIIKVNSIIGTRGVPNINPFNLRPGLTNAKLFIRDKLICNDGFYSSIPVQTLPESGFANSPACSNKPIRALASPVAKSPRISWAQNASSQPPAVQHVPRGQRRKRIHEDLHMIGEGARILAMDSTCTPERCLVLPVRKSARHVASVKELI